MSKIGSKMEALLELAKDGHVRTRDLAAQGIPRTYLRRLCDRGLLERVDRGLYRLVDAQITEFHALAQVCKRVPHAVISLISALRFHELTTELPHDVWVIIDRRARVPKLSYPKLQIVRASGTALSHGVETHCIEGVTVMITSPAKTVADCFRYRQHTGLDVAIAALRDYLTQYRVAVDPLVAAARADRIFAVMRPYLEALV